MTTDLDDLLRQSMRRNAEDAPRALDTDRIHVRAATITRRRRLEAAGAVVAALAVVGAAAYGLTRPSGGAPEPVAPSPSPTTSVSVPPAPASPAWTASLAEIPGSTPPATAIQVRVGGSVERLDQIDNSAASLAGWTGPDRRTLVWGSSQDYPGDQALFSAEFSQDGSVVSPGAPLRAPDGTELIGRAFVLADGSLVVWQRTAVRGQQVTGRLLRYSADLATATTQTLPPGDAIFATSQFVGLQDASSANAKLTLVGTSGLRMTDDLALGSCATGFRAAVSPSERDVAMWCGESIELISLSGDGATGIGWGGRPLDDAGNVIAAWWDRDGHLWASAGTADSTAVTTWRNDYDPLHGLGSSWIKADGQDVVYRWYVDGYSIALQGPGAIGTFTTWGEWRTETDPRSDLGIGYYADQWGPSLVVRPTR
jgi:hypothetical protein